MVRQSLGTLLPLNSVWSRKFPGDYFESGKLFIDWLSKTGQNAWQMLPLGANSWDGHEEKFASPYYSYGIGFNPKFLRAEERENLLIATDEFIAANEDWISDYGLFCAIADKMGTDLWSNWPDKLRNRNSVETESFLFEHKSEIDNFINVQYTLARKYEELKKYGLEKGVEIWGDLPFFLPINSPLVWAHREAFEIESDGSMQFVTGAVPSKYFQRQVWGHPHYKWGTKQGFDEARKLWKLRVRFLAGIVPYFRIDSVIRLFIYSKLHVNNGELDQTCNGPGTDFFAELVSYARGLGTDLFAEDVTGFDMTILHQAMLRVGVPGVSVLVMGLAKQMREFDRDHFNVELFDSSHIYYTATHDVSPMKSYFEQLPDWQKEIVIEKLGLKFDLDASKMTINARKMLISRCRNLIVLMQDWILSKERVNEPGTQSVDNWNYKLEVPVEELEKAMVK